MTTPDNRTLWELVEAVYERRRALTRGAQNKALARETAAREAIDAALRGDGENKP